MDNQNFGNGFQQQMYQQPMNNNLEEPVTFGEWIVLWLIMCVPCLNIIMLCVWAFSSSTKPSKANFCKAYLLVTVILIVLFAILYAIMGAALVGAMSSLGFIF